MLDKFNELLLDEYDTGKISFETYNRCIDIAKNIELLDILEPTSKTTNLLITLICLLKKLEPFQLLDLTTGEA